MVKARIWQTLRDVLLNFHTRQLEKLLEQECARFRYLNCSIATVVYFKSSAKLDARFPRLFRTLNRVSGIIVNGLSNKEPSHGAFGELSKELLAAAGRLKHQGFR